jgi:hypothetical protein
VTLPTSVASHTDAKKAKRALGLPAEERYLRQPQEAGDRWRAESFHERRLHQIEVRLTRGQRARWRCGSAGCDLRRGVVAGGRDQA